MKAKDIAKWKCCEILAEKHLINIEIKGDIFRLRSKIHDIVGEFTTLAEVEDYLADQQITPEDIFFWKKTEELAKKHFMDIHIGEEDFKLIDIESSAKWFFKTVGEALAFLNGYEHCKKK